MASKETLSNGFFWYTLQIFLVVAAWSEAFSASVKGKWENPCRGSRIASIPTSSSEDSREYIQPFSLGAYNTLLQEVKNFSHSFKNQIKAFINDPDTIERLEDDIQIGTRESARNLNRSLTPEIDTLMENFPRSTLNRSSNPVERKEEVYQIISRVYIFLNQREREGNEPAKKGLLHNINWQLTNILCALYANGIRPLVPLNPELVPRMPAGAGRSDRDEYDYILAELTIRILQGLDNYL